MALSCASAFPSDVQHPACYPWCNRSADNHCDRCKCSACAFCQTPRRPRHDGAHALWAELSDRQKLSQPLALYRTAYTDADGSPGCVGALRQPLAPTPRLALQRRDELQRLVLRSCAALASPSPSAPQRPRLPAIFFQEALHGAEGGTVFPTPAALGSSWDVRLARAVFSRIAADARALGSHMVALPAASPAPTPPRGTAASLLAQVLAPVLDLFVDARFGRLQEGFGEDPMHVGAYAAAAAAGLQGGAPLEALPDDKVLAVGKHFVGYGAAAGGQNGAQAAVPERALLEDHMRPWRAFARAGGRSAMAGHHVALGVPAHANRRMLTDILRSELRMSGPVFSDCNDIGALLHARVAHNYTDAAALAMWAGIDIDLQCGQHCPPRRGGGACGAYTRLAEARAQGLLPEETLRVAVTRLLRAKLRAGVLRSPFAAEGEEAEAGGALSSLDDEPSRRLALHAAERAAVLLRNDGVLPLPPSGRLGLVGALGGCDGEAAALCDAQLALLGSYASLLSRGTARVDTLRTALGARLAAAGGTLRFARGASPDAKDTAGVDAAVALARECDVVVAVLGDSTSTAGEWADRVSLDLPGGQPALLQAISATGARLVVVLISGRPATFGGALGDSLLANVSALLVSYPPGQMGAEAITRLLLGDAVPSGKLAFSWPRRPGASAWLQPRVGKWAVHSWEAAGHDLRIDGRYIDGEASPLFPFGFGLSYSRFTLSGLDMVSLGLHSVPLVARAYLWVRNEGAFDAREVVQCYARDPVVRHARRRQRLVGFETAEVRSGLSVRVEIGLGTDDMAMLDDEQVWRVVPGVYLIACGTSSRDSNALFARLTL